MLAALGCTFGAVGTGGLPPIAGAGFAPTWGLAGIAGLAGMEGFALIAGGTLEAEEAGREVGGVESAEGVADAAFFAFQEGTAEPLVTAGAVGAEEAAGGRAATGRDGGGGGGGGGGACSTFFR